MLKHLDRTIQAVTLGMGLPMSQQFGQHLLKGLSPLDRLCCQRTQQSMQWLQKAVETGGIDRIKSQAAVSNLL